MDKLDFARFLISYGKSNFFLENNDLLHFVSIIENLIDTSSKQISIGRFIKIMVCYEWKRLGFMTKNVANPI